jgi:hypothetical protein
MPGRRAVAAARRPAAESTPDRNGLNRPDQSVLFTAHPAEYRPID